MTAFTVASELPERLHGYVLLAYGEARFRTHLGDTAETTLCGIDGFDDWGTTLTELWPDGDRKRHVCPACFRAADRRHSGEVLREHATRRA